MGEVFFHFTRASFMDRQLRMEDLPQHGQAHVVVRTSNLKISRPTDYREFKKL